MSIAAGAALATQAAAEYVGVLLSGAARSIRNGLSSAGDFAADHPVAVIAGTAAFLLLLRMGRRRR